MGTSLINSPLSPLCLGPFSAYRNDIILAYHWLIKMYSGQLFVNQNHTGLPLVNQYKYLSSISQSKCILAYHWSIQMYIGLPLVNQNVYWPIQKCLSLCKFYNRNLATFIMIFLLFFQNQSNICGHGGLDSSSSW